MQIQNDRFVQDALSHTMITHSECNDSLWPINNLQYLHVTFLIYFWRYTFWSWYQKKDRLPGTIHDLGLFKKQKIRVESSQVKSSLVDTMQPKRAVTLLVIYFEFNRTTQAPSPWQGLNKKKITWHFLNKYNA